MSDRNYPKFCKDCGGNVDYPRCRNLCARYTAHQMIKEEVKEAKDEQKGWYDYVGQSSKRRRYTPNMFKNKSHKYL